jgi:malonyl-CoA O-methyltransferase
VRHYVHDADMWSCACAAAGLRIVTRAEPRIDARDIPAGARFDARALEVPVALVHLLRREETG